MKNSELVKRIKKAHREDDKIATLRRASVPHFPEFAVKREEVVKRWDGLGKLLRHKMQFVPGGVPLALDFGTELYAFLLSDCCNEKEAILRLFSEWVVLV